MVTTGLPLPKVKVQVTVAAGQSLAQVAVDSPDSQTLLPQTEVVIGQSPGQLSELSIESQMWFPH